MMVVDALRRHLRQWLCAGCHSRHEEVDMTRLDRAEQLHTLSGLAVSIETEKQIKRVGDMRIAASAAVRRLAHEKREIEGGEDR